MADVETVEQWLAKGNMIRQFGNEQLRDLESPFWGKKQWPSKRYHFNSGGAPSERTTRHAEVCEASHVEDPGGVMRYIRSFRGKGM